MTNYSIHQTVIAASNSSSNSRNSSKDFSTPVSIIQNNNASRLVEGLSLISLDWVLTPVLSDKRPYRNNWQKEVLSRDELVKIIQQGKPTGYGLKTGVVSGGILAIDCDGTTAHEKLKELGGLPETVSFTSGKTGRCQYLVRVPEEFWGVVKTCKINTGNKEQLEFRWDGCQSVLPPSVHPETGSYNWVNSPQDCEVAECPTWLIEYFLNQSTPAAAPTPLLHLPTLSVPLYQCLSKDDRALIDSGAGEGERNDRGAKLARNLIGTATRLQHLGHHFEGDPRRLFDDYCARCSPPIDIKENETIWRSAEQDNPTATLTDDAIENCIKSWNRQQQVSERSHSSQSAKSSNVIIHPTVKTQEPVDFEKIKTDFLQLLDNGAKKTELEQFKIATRQEFPQLQPGELTALLTATEQEFYRDEKLLDAQEELDNLLKIGEQTINLSDYLPGTLAQPMQMYAQWQNIRQAVLLTSLLTSVSSLHKVGTKLILHRNMNFTVPPGLYSAVVSDSGSKKSPIFRATAKDPLLKMRSSRHEEYSENYQLYQQELNEWEEQNPKLKRGQKPETPQPQEPVKPPIFYCTDATGEGIKAQAQSSPDKSIFLLVDELAGMFSSQNAYRGGRGSDKQDLLSYFDGTGATVLRAGGVKVDIAHIYLSILGTIQPEVLQRLMGDTQDSDGSWARFLFAIQPNVPSELPDDTANGVSISELLTGYFERVFSLEQTDYTLSTGAFRLFQKFYNRVEQLRVSHPSPGLRTVYGKAAGLVGRLALNLHVLHEVASGNLPSSEVSEDIMRKAIALMKFYVGQVQLVHAQVNDSGSIAPHILRVIELSNRNQFGGGDGWVKAKDIQLNTTKKFRPSPETAREWMEQAAKLGYGTMRGQGKRLEFNSKVDKSRQKVDDLSTVETIGISTSQIKVDKVDKVDDSKFYDYPSNLDIPNTLNQEVQTEKVDNGCLLVYQMAETIDTAVVSAVDNPSTFVSTNSELSTFPSTVTDHKVDITPPVGIKEGDIIRCYPTQNYYKRKKPVDATVIQISYQDEHILSCEVEYMVNKQVHGSWVKRSHKATICGANSDWIKAIIVHCG